MASVRQRWCPPTLTICIPIAFKPVRCCKPLSTYREDYQSHCSGLLTGLACSYFPALSCQKKEDVNLTTSACDKIQDSLAVPPGRQLTSQVEAGTKIDSSWHSSRDRSCSRSCPADSSCSCTCHGSSTHWWWGWLPHREAVVAARSCCLSLRGPAQACSLRLMFWSLKRGRKTCWNLSLADLLPLKVEWLICCNAVPTNCLKCFLQALNVKGAYFQACRELYLHNDEQNHSWRHCESRPGELNPSPQGSPEACY